MSEWVVPGYTELKLLGAGGFGSVRLARHDGTGTAVAVKYLRPELRGEPGFIEMFRAETQALGGLDDPHVVRLYEYVESAAGAAIVMELIDGVTLQDVLRQHGRTTPEAALVVLYGSLLGLAAAHARGVVHRDFKPANVLVNAYGASKLTDFGIAARAGAATVPAGSVAYAPPEQFGGGQASPAADVYAATATFYECLAGRPPFTGPTNEAVMWQHQTASVPMDLIPEPLQPIIARGMAKDPRYRPSDAAALAADLRVAAAGAYGPDWEQRGRSHLGAAAVLLAALWPSAGLPALHVASLEQVNLFQDAQHAHNVQAAHHSQATKAGLHRWHLRHVLHLDHLARTAAVTVTAAAVVAAAATVVYTSRAPGGPGTAAQPAVAAYQAPLAPPVSPGLAASVSVNGSLSGVVATSTGNAWAVGTDGTGHTLIEHWNGSAWKRQSSPSPGSKGAYDTLTAVAATSPDNAWAVGSTQSLSGTKALMEHWNGSAWQTVQSPSLTGIASLGGVTMLSAGNAWAVGFAGGKTLILHWNGATWQQVGPGIAGALEAVVATSASSAWAVGYAGIPGGAGIPGNNSPLILHWNGATWEQVSANLPPGLGNLRSVTATSAGNAWAVGCTGCLAAGAGDPLIEQWNGTTWTKVPAPTSAALAGFYGVTATSSTNAWAVGTGSTTGIAHWNGHTWALVPSPTSGGQAGAVGVTATSAGNAWAVGSTEATAPFKGVISYWNGSTWG